MTSASRIMLLGTDTAGTITGVTTGTSIPIFCGDQMVAMTLYLASIGTTSGGTITFEEADYAGHIDNTYTGTWSAITTAISASSFTGGAQYAYHPTAPSLFSYVRVRISSTITGGGSIWAALRMR